MLNFCDFIQVFVFTRNHHLKEPYLIQKSKQLIEHSFLEKRPGCLLEQGCLLALIR